MARVRFEDLFAGFHRAFLPPLAIASLLYAVANIVVMMASGIVIALLGGSMTLFFRW